MGGACCSAELRATSSSAPLVNTVHMHTCMRVNINKEREEQIDKTQERLLWSGRDRLAAGGFCFYFFLRNSSLRGVTA